MPIYEYTCESCGHELEALQGLNDDQLSDCPECGDAALRKRISRVAFRLKGSGWYETDFKDKDKRNVAGDSGGNSDSSSSSGGEASGGSESSGDSGSSSEGSGGESKGSGQGSGETKSSSGSGNTASSSSSGASGSGSGGDD